MTTVTDICNRALQKIGTRTNVTDTELANATTNEAIQFNLSYENVRDDLLRMAPWDCALKTANLNYITSVPGTPENTSPATQLWTPGQPSPPWSYEYQYPVDCLRACWIIPANQTGFSGGVPITTAVTGGAAAFWSGPPVRFKVQTDEFFPVISATPAVGGINYNLGDVVTLAYGPTTSPPIGAPAQVIVTGVSGGGVITSVDVVSVIMDSTLPSGGSYFLQQANPVDQGSVYSIGLVQGSGARFTLNYGPKGTQRVILTNQEFATLVYCKRIIDPNVMDTLFQSAWTSIMGATMAMSLSGDKKLANGLIQMANQDIAEAREADGNEGLTINDVTPDWIRVRGTAWDNEQSGPYGAFDWGSDWGGY